MGILKTVTLSALLASSLFAKVDFKNFGNICDSSKICKNRGVEIKVVQFLLKKRFDPTVEVNGEWNLKTKNAIISFQKKNGIPATGIVDLKTKIALNILLYGKSDKVAQDSLHKTENLVQAPKKSSATLAKKSTQAKSVKIAVKKKKYIDLSSYSKFKQSVNLRKSFAVYKNPKLLHIAKRAKTHLKVDVSQQRIKLVVNGKIALDAPCTTGAKRKLEPNTRTIRDKRTPLGTFRIMEKIATKRSTIFGDIYRHGRLVYHGDRRKYRGSWRGAKFIGHPLKNWMRLTSGGIGMHASKYVKRYPASNGCIRLPKSVANTLFASIRKGTLVRISN